MSKFYDLQHVQPDARDLERLRIYRDELAEMAHDPVLAPVDSDRDAALFWALSAVESEIRRLELLIKPTI